MLSFQTDTEERIVFITAIGVIRAADFQAIMPKLSEALSGWESFRALFDWENLEGWEPAAESDALIARVQFRPRVARVAIIADQKWRSEIARISEIFDCEVRRFELSEGDEARAWLGANSSTRPDD